MNQAVTQALQRREQFEGTQFVTLLDQLTATYREKKS